MVTNNQSHKQNQSKRPFTKRDFGKVSESVTRPNLEQQPKSRFGHGK